MMHSPSQSSGRYRVVVVYTPSILFNRREAHKSIVFERELLYIDRIRNRPACRKNF